MFRNRLKLKVGLYLALALSPALVLVPMLIIEYQQKHLQAEVSRHVIQIAEVLVKSTRYAMLINQREIAGKIIEDVGRQAGIERVRVLTKDGTIIHSKRKAETGYSVEQNEEPCVRCHLGGKALSGVPEDQRLRVYTTDDGHRVLAAMEPIRNEPACSNAACHEHPAGQSVLGVVDIAYSLDDIDHALQRQAMMIFAIVAGGIVVVAIGVGVLLQRLIYVPLKDLSAGARHIADGDLDQPIPVRSDDEFGRVARSFNQMGEALRKSVLELQDMVQTLEDKVEQRTRELRTAEAEVAQGEKLAAIGLFASGIAHELNNPLTGVLTFASLLRQKMPDGSADAEDLDVVIRETKRCAAIIRRLLDFAREKVPTKDYVDLNALTEDVVRFVERPATLQNIEIGLRADPALPKVWADADLLKQVLLNVLVNATQAISGTGRIDVETRRLAAAGSGVPMVEVAVRDTGCGIPEANLQRIFDPFFTSKEVGQGTGLGLSVSYGIVKAHGGAIKVESTVGQGSTFRIQLPTAPPIAERATPTPTASEA